MSDGRMRCYYEVLELQRDCEGDEIKKQYRRLALLWHPDKNVGNEIVATANFKEITTAHAVLINPQERKWYDDHRDNILSGGDGTAKTGEATDDPEENLWPFFNAGCFKGFSDGEEGFYGVYRGLFSQLHEDECASGSTKAAAPMYSFGSKEYVAKEVLDFYSHWSNFVTSMTFGHADIYDVREAPNRIVKRAIEKENKKARDEVKRKYQDQVRALVGFVRGLDPRMSKIESERRKKKAEEDDMRAVKKAAEVEAKKQLRIRRQQQLENDEEELERRERERDRAYLLADNDDEYNEMHRAAEAVDDMEIEDGEGSGGSGEEDDTAPGGTKVKKVKAKVESAPRGSRTCFAFVKGECKRGNKCEFAHEAIPVAMADVMMEEASVEEDDTEDDEDEEFVIMRCEICRLVNEIVPLCGFYMF
jgi:DnaJ family protein A protein 5